MTKFRYYLFSPEHLSYVMLKLPSLPVTLVFVTTLGLILGSAQTPAAQSRAPWVGKDLTGERCSSSQPTSGPFDYLQRARHAGALRVVEENHFDQGVASLRKGLSTTPMGDIDFTLKAFPNHHGALNSAMTYSLRFPRFPKNSKGLPAECYFQRALAFSPNDDTARVMFGIYLHKKGKYNRAIKEYREAEKSRKNDLVLYYNMGLTLVKLERYNGAKNMATKVYDAGFPLPGLKKQLKALGYWEDEGPPPPPEPGSPEAAVATANAVAKAMKANKIPPGSGGGVNAANFGAAASSIGSGNAPESKTSDTPQPNRDSPSDSSGGTPGALAEPTEAAAPPIDSGETPQPTSAEGG
ncbi:MAG: tetratricopeptide repeat protein [Pseudomonadota bacterium]